MSYELIVFTTPVSAQLTDYRGIHALYIHVHVTVGGCNSNAVKAGASDRYFVVVTLLV